MVRSRERLAAVRELFRGLAFIRQNEGLQGADKLMEPVLSCFFLQTLE